ncbi:hypothetical protein R1flu_013236 [Riccia fluitans]|uniref:Reverse transcriptase zinc-binding domain-containing protein n=1 Tax=Riccia fluitans TaxID=41844 RepID=A0ABD1YCZ3_9MARC
MALMKKQEREGNLEGLHLGGSRTALYNFFADDSGVFLKATQMNFKTLQQTINMYEKISGAKLNLEKSTVIPIGMTSTPQWLCTSGCYIAREGEPVRYLGYPIGRRVPGSQLLNYIAGKFEQKLGNWVYRFLTFEGRLIVLRHIIRSIPVYVLSCIALDLQTLKKMEQVCRHFVWGKNIQGRDKIPLLAWEDLQPAKGDGGLDIPSFALQGDTQKLRLILRMVYHPGEDWMIALGELLKWKVDKGRWAASMRHWAVEEILMVNCPGKIQGARTATGLLKIWARARAELEIPRKEFTPQGESRAEVTITIGEQQGWLTAVEAKAIKATLRRHKILTIGQWMDCAAWNDARRPLPWLEQTAVEVGLDLFPTSIPIQSLPWTWKSKKRRGEWFTATTKDCRKLIGSPRRLVDSLNRKWNRAEGNRKWRKRFQRIWKSKLTTKDKLWLWKVLSSGLPMLDRMQKIGHGDGVCARCRSAIETPEHLLWQCKDTADRWKDFRYLTEALPCYIPRAECFIDAVDAAFRGQDQGKIIPFTLITRAAWLDRNRMTYMQQRTWTPVSSTLRFAVEVMNSLRWKLDPTSKAARRLESAENMLKKAASRAGESKSTIENIVQDGEAADEVDRGGEDRDLPSADSGHDDEEEDITR